MTNTSLHHSDKKPLRIVVVILVFLLMCLVSILGTKQVLEIDRHSGKVRETWKLFGMTLKSQVSDTEFSKMAAPYVTENIPDWKKDCQFPLFGRHVSPHYRYHGATFAMQEIALGIQNQTLSNEKKSELLIQSLEYLNDFSKKDVFYEIMSHLSVEYKQINTE